MKDIKLIKEWVHTDEAGAEHPYPVETILGVDDATAASLIKDGFGVAFNPKAPESDKVIVKEGEAGGTVAFMRTTIRSAVDEALEANREKHLLTPTVKDFMTTGGFKDSSHFLVDMANAQSPDRRPSKAWDTYRKTVGSDEMSEGTFGDGGSTVPTEFLAQLLSIDHASEGIIGRCRQIPMGSNALDLSRVVESSRATGSRWGGVQGNWTAEKGQKSASKPKTGQLKLTLNEIIVLTFVTNQLLEDSAISIPALIGQAASEELTWMVEDAIVQGTGAGQPMGILNAPCLKSVAKETVGGAQAADTIVAENVIKMYAGLHARSMNNSVWLVNQNAIPQLHTMAISVGTGGIPVYMPAGGLSGAPFATLYGRPVIFSEHVTALGDLGDIYLADFSQYILGTRSATPNFAMSPHLRFDYNELAFRWEWRVDGQPWWASTLTMPDTVTTVSPFVALAART